MLVKKAFWLYESEHQIFIVGNQPLEHQSFRCDVVAALNSTDAGQTEIELSALELSDDFPEFPSALWRSLDNFFYDVFEKMSSCFYDSNRLEAGTLYPVYVCGVEDLDVPDDAFVITDSCTFKTLGKNSTVYSVGKCGVDGVHELPKDEALDFDLMLAIAERHFNKVGG